MLCSLLEQLSSDLGSVKIINLRRAVFQIPVPIKVFTMQYKYIVNIF